MRHWICGNNWTRIRSKCIKCKLLNNSQILHVAPFNLHGIWVYKSIWPESCCDFQPLEALAFWSAGSGCSFSSVLCTLYSVLGCCTAVLLSSTPAPTLWSSTGAAARETWSQVTQCYNTISCDFDTVSGDHFDTCGRGEGQNKWFGSILLSLLVMDSLFQIDVNTNHGVGRFLTGHQCWLGLYPLS